MCNCISDFVYSARMFLFTVVINQCKTVVYIGISCPHLRCAPKVPPIGPKRLGCFYTARCTKYFGRTWLIMRLITWTHRLTFRQDSWLWDSECPIANHIDHQSQGSPIATNCDATSNEEYIVRNSTESFEYYPCAFLSFAHYYLYNMGHMNPATPSNLKNCASVTEEKGA